MAQLYKFSTGHQIDPTALVGISPIQEGLRHTQFFEVYGIGFQLRISDYDRKDIFATYREFEGVIMSARARFPHDS